MRPLGFGRRAQNGTATAATGSKKVPSAIGAGGRSLVNTEDENRPVNLSSRNASNGANVDRIYELMCETVLTLLPTEEVHNKSRSDLIDLIYDATKACAQSNELVVTDADIRDAVTVLMNDLIDHVGGLKTDPFVEKTAAQTPVSLRVASASIERVIEAKNNIFPLLMEHVDASAMAELSRGELAEQISAVVGDLLRQQNKNLNTVEQRDLVTLLLNDMLGLGPLEPLLGDEAITDIMVNGPNNVYAERKGKLELTGIVFRDESHLLNIAQRIVSAVGRRVDETSPICDARLLDGSRVNVIIPPLAIDGTTISIRKFSKRKITLDMMAQQGNIHPKMAQILKIAGRCRLNIVISGGTGSGKTTLLNAVSRNIDEGERIVTIEDAAELQLQQPHVVRLETRPANIEGNGEINMRDLVKNSLRMRPDRIILGEVRGPEAVDLLQAMNTGHDGSLGTLHANRPREALTRLENMVNMAGLNLPPKAIRTQIADAVHLIIQISRMRDGVRRISYITEVVGMEGDVVVTQDLYTYQYMGEDEHGKLKGDFVSSGLRPNFYDRAEYYGLGRQLMECM
jgi:pilus assembly protein CpaF